MSLPTPTLRTARLLLRPFADKDAEAMFAILGNARVVRYWDAPAWHERAQAERFIANAGRMEREGTGARLAIERVEDGTVIGQCGLLYWNPAFRSATLTYTLRDDAWGQGFATEAVGALLAWAFQAWDLNRVQAETDTRNGASLRVLDKLGFVREGTLREDCVVDGDVSDSAVYGLLRREWAAFAQRRTMQPAKAGGREDVPGFAVIYRWRLREGAEARFVDAWTRVSRHLRAEGGSFGSRLHRSADGLWYSYAQWPSAQARATAFAMPPIDPEASAIMRDSIAEAMPEVVLEPVVDLLVLPPRAPMQSSG